MTKPENTKLRLAQALKELMKKAPLDKIGIGDISDACGLNRKTFYYHFQDKQALVCWIFDEEFAGITDLDGDNTVVDELADHLYRNKDFYVAALTSDVQNSLREHLFNLCSASIYSRILALIGTNHIIPNDMKMITNFFANALIGCLLQWAREGMKVSPDEYSEKLHIIIQDCLKFAIDQYMIR